MRDFERRGVRQNTAACFTLQKNCKRRNLLALNNWLLVHNAIWVLVLKNKSDLFICFIITSETTRIGLILIELMLPRGIDTNEVNSLQSANVSLLSGKQIWLDFHRCQVPHWKQGRVVVERSTVALPSSSWLLCWIIGDSIQVDYKRNYSRSYFLEIISDRSNEALNLRVQCEEHICRKTEGDHIQEHSCIATQMVMICLTMNWCNALTKKIWV